MRVFRSDYYSEGDTKEPNTYQEAITCADRLKWKAMKEAEIKSLERNDVWDLVELPEKCEVVGSKWVFKLKAKKPLQLIDNSGALHPLPNCLDGLKAAALFKFQSILIKTFLCTYVTVSTSFKMFVFCQELLIMSELLTSYPFLALMIKITLPGSYKQ